MDFFCRSMSRRRRASATLAWSETLPSGRILPSSSLKQRAEIADGLRALAQAREALGDARSAATWRRPRDPAARRRRRFPCGSRLAPSMRSLWTAGSVSGRPPKSMRMAAPRAAVCGREAERRYSMASPASARSASNGSRSWMRLEFLQLAPAQSRGHVAAHQIAHAFEFEHFGAGSHANPSAFAEALLDHAERAFGDLQLGKIARGAPIPRGTRRRRPEGRRR